MSAIAPDRRPTPNGTTGHAPVTALPPKAERTVDASQRRAEIVIAALFLLTAAASIFGAFALEPGLYGADYLSKIFPNQATVVSNALLWSFTNLGTVFIAVFAYPVLRNSMRPWRPATWRPGSSRAPS